MMGIWTGVPYSAVSHGELVQRAAPAGRVEIGRGEARELARRELEKPIYHRDEPSLLDRAVTEVQEFFDRLFSISGEPGSGAGWLALVVLIAVVLAVIALVWWRTGGIQHGGGRRGALLTEEPTMAKDHRAAAERHAVAGEWADAIHERLRAIARDLEERAILDPRPGRTADELAVQAGVALPDHADELRAGVGVFDDVWYGGREGTAEGYQRLTRLDERLRAARPVPLQPAGNLR